MSSPTSILFCISASKALANLSICAGSLAPSLLINTISKIPDGVPLKYIKYKCVMF